MAHCPASGLRHSEDLRNTILAALAVLAAEAIAHGSAQRPAPRGRLSGVIVDADTGSPLPAVRVAVTSSVAGSAVVTAVSDASGRYGVTALAAGTYTVTATKAAYVEATFGRRHQIDTGGTIDV